MVMDRQEQDRLLTYAREVVRAELAGAAEPGLDDPKLAGADFSGAFVTLRKLGQLRGCIGTFSPSGTLPETIAEMAVAATRDPRFLHMPIQPAELGEIDIEISILSPLRRTQDPLSLELGKHGVYIKRGHMSGCFLPQVATEQGWTKVQFLSRCCDGKAGLPADAWKDPNTEVYLFTAEIFGDKGEGRPA